ncbi:hypothetical protein QBC38DRAFT_235495 [Podospora fimiseda]|uniref:Secreted protein n=1 Tax=Podospora fimiseda TaxID=252190 RepID=A0AAN7H2C9_9PEZI|nr:hypothetical protein QBC38DRAFT_235495 [Podospora fimiseda]
MVFYLCLYILFRSVTDFVSACSEQNSLVWFIRIYGVQFLNSHVLVCAVASSKHYFHAFPDFFIKQETRCVAKALITKL